MPDRKASQRETEDALGRNTVALIECGGKQQGLATYIRNRDAALAPAP